MLSRVSTVVNKAKAYIFGFNANISADVSRHVSFSSILNYTYGRLNEAPENYPLDHIPPFYGKTSANLHLTNFTGEFFILYNGSKKGKNYNLRGEDNQIYSADPVNGFSPWWITTNFRSQYQINKHFTVQFAMENIGDKFYRFFLQGYQHPAEILFFHLELNFDVVKINQVVLNQWICFTTSSKY